MSLLTIRNKVARVTGQSVTDDQVVLDDWINTEAERLYRENDFPDCLAESTLKVTESSFIALPSYVGQLRGVRENRWLRKWQITSMFPRYVSSPTWNIEKGWRAWRVIGRSPCMMNLSGSSPIILKVDGLEVSSPPQVAIKGSTTSSHNKSEVVSISQLSNQTSNIFLPNPVSITKNKVNDYNILGTDIAGNILFVINNDELEAKYIIVNIQGYPFKGCNSDVVRPYRCVDVLYKRTFRKMINEGDSFICGSEYEDLIVDQVCGFWAEQSADIQKAMYYYGKTQAQLKSIFEDKTGGEEHRMHFAPSGFFGWFDRFMGQPAGDLCCGDGSEDCCDDSGQTLSPTTVIPPQIGTTLYYNTKQVFPVGCPLNTTGASAIGIAEAGLYSSSYSVDAANIIASLAAKADGLAKLNCTASLTYYNTAQFFTASCGAGLTGNPVTVTIHEGTYSNKTSQISIDTFALQQATLQANQQLVCIAASSGCLVNLGTNGIGNYDHTFTIAALGAPLDVTLSSGGNFTSIAIYANAVLLVPVGAVYTLPNGTTTIRVVVSAIAGDIYGYSLVSTITPSIQGSLASFGVQPINDYKILYTGGTLAYGSTAFGHGWKVSDYPGADGHNYKVIHSNASVTVEFPVNTYYDYPTQVDGETGNLGATLLFNHSISSEIKMRLNDVPYGDNIAGTTIPTFQLFAKADGAWQWSLTCDPVVCLVELGTVTASVNPNLNGNGNFGTFSAGNYRILYLGGAFTYVAGPGGWTANMESILEGFFVYLSNIQDVRWPGLFTAYSPDTTVVEVEAANAGIYIDFVHTGGDIGIFLIDSEYGDNSAAGTPPYTGPTFRLYKNNCP